MLPFVAEWDFLLYSLFLIKTFILIIVRQKYYQELANILGRNCKLCCLVPDQRLSRRWILSRIQCPQKRSRLIELRL
jgi:hypothetical protein